MNEFPSTKQTDRLDGRTALVTGSTRGIGEAIARVLSDAGAEVMVTGRDRDRAERVVASIIAVGGKAHALTSDLTAPPAASGNSPTRPEAP